MNIRHHPVRRRAFTLIEMLVVMAVIVILAGLTISGFGVIKKKTRIARVQGELARLQTAIESYKQALGFYPPDNPPPQPPPSPLSPEAAKEIWACSTPLFYELSGTVILGGTYQVVDGSETIGTNVIQQYFGRAGFANASLDTNQVKTFLPSLRSTQYKEAFQGVDVELLVVPVEGVVLTNNVGATPWRTGTESVNPWRYVSTKPVHNTGEFDLWTDIRIGSKFYRISNWAEPQEFTPVP